MKIQEKNSRPTKPSTLPLPLYSHQSILSPRRQGEFGKVKEGGGTKLALDQSGGTTGVTQQG